MHFLQSLLVHENRGATAVEYSLVVAMISIAVAVASGAIGSRVYGLFGGAASAFK